MNLRYIALASVLVLVAALAFVARDTARLSVSTNPGTGPASHILMFEDGVDADQLLMELESQYGVQSRFIYRYALNGASVVVPDRFLDDVASYRGVKNVEENGTAEFLGSPVEQEVQNWMKRSGMDVGHPLADINGDGVDTDVDIAILDTGVIATHPDINLYVAVECIFGRSGENPPISDDCTRVYDPNDANDTNNDPAASVDVMGHGTRVAGVAAARDNGFGIVGAAPGARIWSVRLSGDDPFWGGTQSSPAAFMDAFAAGFDWVTANALEIDVVNTSMGFVGNSEALRAAVQGTVAAGVTVFAAAGNSHADIYGADGILGTSDDTQPAAYPEVAAISGYVDTDGIPGGLGAAGSSGDPDDSFWVGGLVGDPPMWVGSNFSASVVGSNPVSSPGAAIDFAMSAIDIMATCVANAPGEFGTVEQDCLDHSDGVGGNYGRAGGTSFAAPQAAGLAALLIADRGRDINGDDLVNADDVYALRQLLIDMAVAQNNSAFGLVPVSGDTDGNPDPLGSAGMLLNFDTTSISLVGTGSSQQVTVDTEFVPIAAPETVQLNLLHDVAKFTIQNPQCTGAYASGTPVGPTTNSGNNGTVIGCTLVGGPVADTGPIFTFDVVRADNGGETVTVDGSSTAEGSGFIHSGLPLPNANSPTFSIDFSADISGSFALQSVTDEAALTLIAPSATAVPVGGGADVVGQYDAATGTFVISVPDPGSYDIRADASGFISRLYESVVVDSSGAVTGEPVSSTTLRAGDVDSDGVVNGADASVVIGAFGTTPGNRLDGSGNVVDINGDGVVDISDISILILNFGLAPSNGVEGWSAP